MSQQPERTGRRMSLRSWRPGSLLTPPRSLRTRLVVGVLGLVLVMAAVMSAFSTVSLRHTLMARTDSQLMAAAQRAADKRHDLTQEARKASDEAAQEALEGSTSGLGGVIGAALSRTGPLDTLVVGLSRSAVHDGGLGAMDALGGLRAAKDLLSHRSLGLALADDISLGGMSGAGAALASITSISPERAQELDRRACAKAMESVRVAEDLDPGGLGARRSLPVVSALDDAGPSASAHTADADGAARLSVSTWGTGAGGGSALLLRALGAWARPGARVMAELVSLSDAAYGQDLVVSAWGELYDVLADSVVGVVGQQAASQAQPCILVCGRCAVSRGELAAAGVTNAYGLQEAHAAEPWEATDSHGLERRLTDLGSRLARTWSR